MAGCGLGRGTTRIATSGSTSKFGSGPMRLKMLYHLSIRPPAQRLGCERCIQYDQLWQWGNQRWRRLCPSAPRFFLLRSCTMYLAIFLRMFFLFVWVGNTSWSKLKSMLTSDVPRSLKYLCHTSTDCSLTVRDKEGAQKRWSGWRCITCSVLHQFVYFVVF